MKRLILFALAIVLMAGVSLMPGGLTSKPNEGFGTYTELQLNGAATNRLFASGFYVEKVDMVVTGTDSVTVTIYIPTRGSALDSLGGPFGATDSFTVIAIAPREYYGPVSDTVRIASDGRSTLGFSK